MGAHWRGWAAAAAWGLAAYIVFVTLGPQSLRPHLGPAQLERFAAYFVTAGAFVLAYPKRPLTIAVAGVLLAILLELGQLFVPGRDAGLPDAIAKALGALAGAAVAAGFNSRWRKLWSASAR
ncbi:MAG: hypothetical protein ACHP84_17575 [Caulobacterales bacterium]